MCAPILSYQIFSKESFWQKGDFLFHLWLRFVLTLLMSFGLKRVLLERLLFKNYELLSFIMVICCSSTRSHRTAPQWLVESRNPFAFRLPGSKRHLTVRTAGSNPMPKVDRSRFKHFRFPHSAKSSCHSPLSNSVRRKAS